MNKSFVASLFRDKQIHSETQSYILDISALKEKFYSHDIYRLTIGFSSIVGHSKISFEKGCL
jgi:hypothetical protein